MEHRTSSVSSDVHRMRLQRYLAFTVGLCAALLVALHRLTATRSLAASRPQPRTGSVPLRPPAPAPARRTPNAPSPAPTPPPTGPGPPASPLDLSDTGPATRIPLFRSKLHFFANRGVVPQALLHALDDPENLQVTIPMQVLPGEVPDAALGAARVVVAAEDELLGLWYEDAPGLPLSALSQRNEEYALHYLMSRVQGLPGALPGKPADPSAGAVVELCKAGLRAMQGQPVGDPGRYGPVAWQYLSRVLPPVLALRSRARPPPAVVHHAPSCAPNCTHLCHWSVHDSHRPYLPRPAHRLRVVTLTASDGAPRAPPMQAPATSQTAFLCPIRTATPTPTAGDAACTPAPLLALSAYERIALAALAFGPPRRAPRRSCLSLGLGGGVRDALVARLHAELFVTVLEHDPCVTAIARGFFDFPEPCAPRAQAHCPPDPSADLPVDPAGTGGALSPASDPDLRSAQSTELTIPSVSQLDADGVPQPASSANESACVPPAGCRVRVVRGDALEYVLRTARSGTRYHYINGDVFFLHFPPQHDLAAVVQALHRLTHPQGGVLVLHLQPRAPHKARTLALVRTLFPVLIHGISVYVAVRGPPAFQIPTTRAALGRHLLKAMEDWGYPPAVKYMAAYAFSRAEQTGAYEDEEDGQ